MSVPQNIKDRLRYLLNLANKSQNTQEASNAWQAAQKLMTKYSISEMESKEKTYTIGQGQSFFKSHNTSLWKQRLAAILAGLNNCELIILTKKVPVRSVEFTLIGVDSDREMAEFFFDSVSSQTEELCKKIMPRGGGKTWANNFKYGVVDTVYNRLYTAKQEAAQEVDAGRGQTTALVLLNNRSQEVKEWIRKKIPNLKNVKNHSLVENSEARASGQQAGNQINLAQPLNSSCENTKLFGNI